MDDLNEDMVGLKCSVLCAWLTRTDRKGRQRTFGFGLHLRNLETPQVGGKCGEHYSMFHREGDAGVSALRDAMMMMRDAMR
ncbi:hypothetical protein RB195_013606 [Necator americanus]|uniref:Uncharacterized protein n=1 Tax=Necator americanus TaxID=51031 RepID=A0ABR1DWC2_NECAM